MLYYEVNTYSASVSNLQTDFWDSREVHKLFHVAYDESGMDVVERRENLLKIVNQHPMGYKRIIEGYDKKGDSSIHDIFILKQKSTYLCLRYTYSLQYMNAWKWLDNCYQQGIKDLLFVGYSLATNP